MNRLNMILVSLVLQLSLQARAVDFVLHYGGAPMPLPENNVIAFSTETLGEKSLKVFIGEGKTLRVDFSSRGRRDEIFQLIKHDKVTTLTLPKGEGNRPLDGDKALVNQHVSIRVGKVQPVEED